MTNFAYSYDCKFMGTFLFINQLAGVIFIVMMTFDRAIAIKVNEKEFYYYAIVRFLHYLNNMRLCDSQFDKYYVFNIR